MTEKDLSKELDFVNQNREDLLRQHNGKFLLVSDGILVGAFDTYERAAEEGIRQFGAEGTFLVYQLVQKEPLNFIMQAAI